MLCDRYDRLNLVERFGQVLQLRLIKIGGWVRDLLIRVRLYLASSHPGEALWHLLAPALPTRK